MTMQSKVESSLRHESQGCLIAWCPDDDTRHNVRARRNVLAAFWAGQLLGLSGAELNAYAVEVHFADYEAVGDNDIICKIASDLHRAGSAVGQSTVRSQLQVFHHDALLQTQATD